MAIVEFINERNRTYEGMKRALEYIAKPGKTLEHLMGGFLCNPETAYYEYVLTKQKFHKETGRQFIHFTQSFSPQDKLTPEMAYEIAGKLLNQACFQGFQVKYATHIDREHIHTHFIINSVNMENGRKWQLTQKELGKLKDYSDTLCSEYGLMVISGDKGKHRDRGQYRAEKRGMSWKREIYLAVLKCKFHSVSKEDFMDNMKKFGITGEWKDTHKYITFTNKEGKKCRNRKLYPPEQFTKEALLQQFDLNQQREEQKELHNRLELVLTAIRKLGRDSQWEAGHRYPLQKLEGQSLADEIEEWKKGKGLDWEQEF